MTPTKRPWKVGTKHPCRIIGQVGESGIVGMTTMGFDDEGTETEREKANAALIVQAVNELDRIGGIEGLQDLERQAAKYLDQRHTFGEAKAALKAVAQTWDAPMREYPIVVQAILAQCQAVLAKMEREDHAI